MCPRLYSVHEAAEAGDLQRLEELIAGGCDIEAADALRVRPIHVATLMGYTAIVEALVSRGCDVNAEAQSFIGEKCVTPLHLAARHGSPSISNILIRAGANVNAKNGEHRTALHIAVIFDRTLVAKSLISANICIDSKDSLNITPLLYAVERNCRSIAKLLIKNGADVTVRKSGTTPLHFASQNGSDELANLLLLAGADIDAMNSVGLTPLHLALRHARWKVCDLLINWGASVMEVDDALCTPLHYAANYFCRKTVTQRLIEKGALLDAREHAGRTPLLVAVERDHTSMIGILIRNRADINIPAYDGATPLHCAACLGDTYTVKLLLASGANLHSRRQDHRTPLHYAAAYHQADVCKLLLAAGADVNAVDNEMVTPLHLAVALIDQRQRSLYFPRRDAKGSKLDTIKILIAYGANVNARRAFDPASRTYDVTPFHLAIRSMDLRVIIRLLFNGAYFDAYLCSVKSPSEPRLISTSELALSYGLHCILPFLNITKQLFIELEKRNCRGILKCISEGALPNSASFRHETPLIYASFKGCLPVVDTLVKVGADVNIPGILGVTALHCAAAFGRYSVMCRLLQHGAAFERTTYSYKTPLDYALQGGNKTIVASLRLIARCFDTLKKWNNELERIFKVMLAHNSVDFIKALVNCKNRKRETLLDLAEKLEIENMVSFFKTINKLEHY